MVAIIKLSPGGGSKLATTDKLNVLYKVSVNIGVKSDDTNSKGIKTINVPTSDIVSISIIHNYDRAMFPIVRLRLYSDISLITEITKAPDRLKVNVSLYGNVYRMADEDDKSPALVCGAKNIEFSLKGYIEEKNIPTSNMDQYDQGLKKSEDLNESIKVPIELYCFDDEMMHFMRRRAPSIFKNMSIASVIESLFREQGYVNYSLDPLENQEKYDQILIPNLSITETISFLESRYGLYKFGASVYGDFDGIKIINTKPNPSYSSIIPIYVESYKSNSDMGGLRNNGKASEWSSFGLRPSNFGMNIKAENVSVVSETDIERILNSDKVTSVDVSSLDVNTETMIALYDDVNPTEYLRDIKQRDSITTPDILYKSKNRYMSSIYAARITERITRADISCVGFDIGRINVHSIFNILFDSPIRGMSINRAYRPMNVVHVLSNLDSNHFIAQTTMSICSSYGGIAF